MKRINIIFSTIAGILLLTSCSSFHPPTTDPYYPGYHTRNPATVNEEYDEWQVAQEQRAERQRTQDSLWAEYSENMKDRPLYYSQYNFYGDYGWYGNRYPYYRRYSPWHSPYSYRRPYRPWYGNSWSLRFSYSNQPWFVDTWWADDYLWDRYFWSNPYNSWYSGWYVRPPMYGYGYGGYYNPYYVSDWDYYHSSPGSGSSDQPQTRRPGNRDQFFPSGGGPSSGSASGSATVVSGNNGGRSVTPAVIDRSKYRKDRNSGRDSFFFPSPTQTYQSSTSSNNSKNTKNSSASKANQGNTSATSSSSSSSGSATKSTATSRSTSATKSTSSKRNTSATKSSSGKSSQSSGSSSKSKSSDRRPKNRWP